MPYAKMPFHAWIESRIDENGSKLSGYASCLGTIRSKITRAVGQTVQRMPGARLAARQANSGRRASYTFSSSSRITRSASLIASYTASRASSICFRSSVHGTPAARAAS